MDSITLGGLIVALTQCVKQSNLINSKYLPLVSIGLGGILGVLIGGYSTESLVAGIVIGTTATGLFGAGKDMVATIKK